MANRDFRIWSLPRLAQKLPSELIDLKVGDVREVTLDGGIKTGELITEIVNNNLKNSGTQKCIQCLQDARQSDPNKVTFRAFN